MKLLLFYILKKKEIDHKLDIDMMIYNKKNKIIAMT